MATFEIKMPKLGESITEGTIMTWSVKVGDVINEDDILFEVSTAKVSAEIPSPVAGKILQILFNEGDTVAVGTVVAIVQLEGDSEEETPEVAESTAVEEESSVTLCCTG
jgi:Pyruvate/2-oxoglutarate dehydrogenase complex, dihydrolipoamide acyltransferase (E2) component, and related enzymes